jgi:hypothetical protein
MGDSERIGMTTHHVTGTAGRHAQAKNGRLIP